MVKYNRIHFRIIFFLSYVILTMLRLLLVFYTSFVTIHHFTTFYSSYLIIANIAIILENTGFFNLIGASFAIGYNI